MVLTVDALGTLVALEPPAPRLARELSERFGIGLSEEQAASALGAEIRYYRAHLNQGRDEASLFALRRRCAEVLRGALPASEALAAVDTGSLTDALLAALQFSAFADALPALERTRALGWRVVVASNWDVSLHDVLARVGLSPMLDGIVTSAEVGARKPAREVFERALAVVGAGPDEAVHVGDSIEEDVLGAHGFGIVPILLSRGRDVGPVDGVPAGIRVISSLCELPELLAA